MKIRLITISREEDEHANALTAEYIKRLNHYTSIGLITLKPRKTTSAEEQRKNDAEQVLKKISPQEQVVILDERGSEMTSVEFAGFLTKKMNEGVRGLSFVIGGAYGFDKSIYERSDASISLSKFTLPHQLAKVIFTEQLYRAFTIIRNEKYHH